MGKPPRRGPLLKADSDLADKETKGLGSDTRGDDAALDAIRLDPDNWSDLMDDEFTTDLVAVFTGFMDADEPLEEREDAAQLREEHAARLPEALVVLRHLAAFHE